MANFDHSIGTILRHEGGYVAVDNPNDPGGATKGGISLRFLKSKGYDIDGDGDVDKADVTALTPQMIRHIYKKDFWQPMKLSLIESQIIATKIFDMTVNMGEAQATKLAQRACNQLGCGLVVDGRCGPKTRLAINACNVSRLLSELRAKMKSFYNYIVNRNAQKKQRMIANGDDMSEFQDLSLFLRGWLRRAAA